MKTSSFYINSNNNIINLIDTKKQYERHKNELDNIKKSQSQSINQRSLYSPERKFYEIHDSMKGVFAQSRDYNSRQKMQNILDENKKILNKLKEIQKGEQDSIARQFMEQNPRKLRKRRRTKSRKLKEEIESIAALLEQEDKQLLKDFTGLINAVDAHPMDSNQGNECLNNASLPMQNSKGISSQSPNILLMRKSLNMEFRKEEQRQIAQQNSQLINKIVNVQANINHKELEKDFRQNQKYKKNVRKQSKQRQQFVNNFLQQRFQHAHSSSNDGDHGYLNLISSNQSFLQSPKLNQQNFHQLNGIQEKDQSPSFSFQNVNPNQEHLHGQLNQPIKENSLNHVPEFSLQGSKSKNSSITKKKSILTKTEPDEVEHIQMTTVGSQSKSQSNQNLQEHRKQRSHSLKAGAATLSVSPYLPPRIPNQNDELLRKDFINRVKLLPSKLIKQVQTKCNQQTLQRGNKLLQIYPPRSVSSISNFSPQKQILSGNEVSPQAASKFRINRILSPRGYKFRSHNLHMKKPLSQVDKNSAYITNYFTDQSFQIQKSLSLIESDFEEKQESFNEVEYKSLKQKYEITIQKSQTQQQKIDDQPRQHLNNPKLAPLSKNQQYEQFTNSKIIEIKEQKYNGSQKKIEERNKENINDLGSSLQMKETLEQYQLDQGFTNYTNQEQKNEQKGKSMQENQEFQLQLNDIVLRSPNQIQQSSTTITSQNQDIKHDNLADKEKYLIINTKQRFFKPVGQIPKQQYHIALSSKVVANFHTELVNFNLSSKFTDSAPKNNSRNRIQTLMAKTCCATAHSSENSNPQLTKEKQFQSRRLNSPFIKQSQRCMTTNENR